MNTSNEQFKALIEALNRRNEQIREAQEYGEDFAERLVEAIRI